MSKDTGKRLKRLANAINNSKTNDIATITLLDICQELIVQAEELETEQSKMEETLKAKEAYVQEMVTPVVVEQHLISHINILKTKLYDEVIEAKNGTIVQTALKNRGIEVHHNYNIRTDGYSIRLVID